jgi:hypothetical protein
MRALVTHDGAGNIIHVVVGVPDGMMAGPVLEPSQLLSEVDIPELDDIDLTDPTDRERVHEVIARYKPYRVVREAGTERATLTRQ